MLPPPMSLVLAALVTLSSTVAVRVEETDDVPVEAQRSVARALVRAVEASSGRWAVLDDPEWPSCGTSAACAKEVSARARADATIFLRVVGSITLMRVVARCVDADGKETSAKVDLEQSGEGWPPQLEGLSVELLGAGPKMVRPDLALLRPAEPSGPRVLPIALFAGGAASLGLGILFGALSRDAQLNLDQGFHSEAETVAAQDAKQTEAWAANILFASAAAAALTGVVTLIFGGDAD